jgi:drug/metabolite transporter (DMT)-like permease
MDERLRSHQPAGPAAGYSANLKGAVFGFAALSIWASWSVITRLAVTTSLDAWDIVALRFGVAGLLLSPVLVQRGLARDRLGWLGLAVIIAGTGAPYALVAAFGLRFAPAYDGGALNPGCMPLFVALIAALVLGERLSSARKLGLLLISAGALIVVGWRAAAWSPSGGAAFGALVPALSALLAIPLLDEWPNETDWVGIVLISAGVYLTSGGPLPSWNQRESHP